MFSNHPTVVRSVTAITGINDHEVVVASIRCEPLDIKKPPSRKVFFYDRGNFEGLSNNASSITPEFEECSLHMNINSLWNLFKSELAELVGQHVPSKIITGKRRVDKPWVNKELRALINKKRRLYQRYCKTQLGDVRDRLERIGSYLKIQMKEAK